MESLIQSKANTCEICYGRTDAGTDVAWILWFTASVFQKRFIVIPSSSVHSIYYQLFC